MSSTRASSSMSRTSRTLRSFSTTSIASSSTQSRVTTHFVPPPPKQYPGEKTHFLIQLVRSAHGLPKGSAGALEAIGLGRRHSWALKAHHPTMVGQLLKVKELVTVRNVTKEEGEELLKKFSNKSEDSGVKVVGRVYGGGRRPL